MNVTEEQFKKMLRQWGVPGDMLLVRHGLGEKTPTLWWNDDAYYALATRKNSLSNPEESGWNAVRAFVEATQETDVPLTIDLELSWL